MMTGAKTENACGLCCGLCSPARLPDVPVDGSTVLAGCADGAAAVAIVVAVDDAAAAADEVLLDSLLLLLV